MLVIDPASIPVEYISHDLWESMRAHDKPLADDMLEPNFVLMRCMTEGDGSKFRELGSYLNYREIDLGK